MVALEDGYIQFSFLNDDENFYISNIAKIITESRPFPVYDVFRKLDGSNALSSMKEIKEFFDWRFFTNQKLLREKFSEKFLIDLRDKNHVLKWFNFIFRRNSQ